MVGSNIIWIVLPCRHVNLNGTNTDFILLSRRIYRRHVCVCMCVKEMGKKRTSYIQMCIGRGSARVNLVHHFSLYFLHRIFYVCFFLRSRNLFLNAKRMLDFFYVLTIALCIMYYIFGSCGI